MNLSMYISFIPLVHCVQAFTHLRTDDFLSAHFYFVVSVIQRVTLFLFCSICYSAGYCLGNWGSCA